MYTKVILCHASILGGSNDDRGLSRVAFPNDTKHAKQKNVRKTWETLLTMKNGSNQIKPNVFI
jgi:hypothetical protein